MNVSVVGTGYVGLVSGTCFAEIGHNVTCIDIDERKINLLKDGKSPIYEPGLSELLERNIKDKRLHFATDYSSVAGSQVIFLAVGTPSQNDGSADLKYLEAAAESSGEVIQDDAIIVIKSTVPVGTSEKIRQLVSSKTSKKFHIVNNPEFLKEGSAVEDFMRPDRVVIGYKEEFAAQAMEELYRPLLLQGNPLIKMSNTSAELSKYASNCFLATKISFINEIARLCDLLGADIEEVRKGMSTDIRIGKHFLYPGPGYGGSCFPKDVKALIKTAHGAQTELKIIQAAEDVNAEQKVYMVEKIKKYFRGDLKSKRFAFWGVAFKANTDDIRESSSIDMAVALTEAGADVQFYDPVASKNFETYMQEHYPALAPKCQPHIDPYDCLKNCDGLVTVTEWREFRNPDYQKIKDYLKTPVIFDARNLFVTQQVQAQGLDYLAIGKYIAGNQ